MQNKKPHKTPPRESAGDNKRCFAAYLTTGEVAADMEISPRRVRALIMEPCPVCGGHGLADDGVEIIAENPDVADCNRCFGTGRRMPAEAEGVDRRRTWFVDARYRVIEDLIDRRRGRDVLRTASAKENEE